MSIIKRIRRVVKATLQVVPSVSTCSAETATDTWTAWAVVSVAAYRTAQLDSTVSAVQGVLPSSDADAVVVVAAVAAAAVVVDAVCKTHIQKQVGVLVYSCQGR
jgi:hypothetical protein